MAKLDRERVVLEALAMLDDAGLAGVSTRGLARRLAVEQPALYWHFRSKAALLHAMAEAAMRSHGQEPLPTAGGDWQAWFVANMVSLRRTLLVHRDGARLHAGSRPGGGDAARVAHKIAFLVASGFAEQDATMALLAAGRFTLGSVLEEQADEEATRDGEFTSQVGELAPPDHAMAFETGLAMIVQGLAARRIQFETGARCPIA